MLSANIGANQQELTEISPAQDVREVRVTSSTCSNFTTCQIESSKLDYETRNYTFSGSLYLESGYYLHYNLSVTRDPLTMFFNLKIPSFGNVYVFSDEQYQRFQNGYQSTTVAQWTNVDSLNDGIPSSPYDILHLCVIPRDPCEVTVSGWYSGSFFKVDDSVCIHTFTGNCTLPKVGHRYFLIVENTKALYSISVKAYTEHFEMQSLTIVLVFGIFCLAILVTFIICCGFCIKAPRKRADPDAGKVTQDVTPSDPVRMEAMAGSGPPPAAFAGAGPENTPQGNPEAYAVTPGAVPYPGEDVNNMYGVPM